MALGNGPMANHLQKASGTESADGPLGRLTRDLAAYRWPPLGGYWPSPRRPSSPDNAPEAGLSGLALGIGPMAGHLQKASGVESADGPSGRLRCPSSLGAGSVLEFALRPAGLSGLALATGPSNWPSKAAAAFGAGLTTVPESWLIFVKD